jgi:predicted DNA binding CopG/RHH family protein
MSQNLKPIPKFKNEDEERNFWETADTSEYFDFSKAKRVIFPNLKPTTKSISIRLPEWLIYELKSLANKRNIPY